MMIEIFGILVKAGMKLGEINQAMMYENGFMSIDGKTVDGEKFAITMHFEEEEKDGN
jgi:hypothetical protein